MCAQSPAVSAGDQSRVFASVTERVREESHSGPVGEETVDKCIPGAALSRPGDKNSFRIQRRRHIFKRKEVGIELDCVDGENNSNILCKENASEFDTVWADMQVNT